jgi:hypothetical protein
MKYYLSAAVTISVSAEVEAESAEDVIRKGEELGMPMLCAQCTRHHDDDCWRLSEIDGEAQNINAEVDR